MRQGGFGELQEGVDYFFETMLGFTADVDLPFAPDSAADLRFTAGNYKQGTLWSYAAVDSMETNEIAITRVDDQQAP